MDMAFWEGSHRKYTLWASVIVGCLVGFLFSGISIYSSYNQHENMAFLVRHPVKVSEALYTFSRNMAKTEIYTDRLRYYNEEPDVQRVKKLIDEIVPQSEAALQYMLSNYLGPREQTERVQTLFGEIQQQRAELYKVAGPMDNASVSSFIDHRLAPLYVELNDILNNQIRTFIDQTPQRLLGESTRLLKYNMILSILVALLLPVVVVAVVVVIVRSEQKLMQRRMEEQTFRNSLFEIISEHAGNVFMLYNLQKGMEYVSANVSALLGLDASKVEKEPRILFTQCASDSAEVFERFLSSEVLQTPAEKECRFINAVTREEIWMQVGIYPVRERGVVTRYVISLSDMTEMSKTQQVLRDALLNAQGANRAKSEFLSRMSHEIRTPMNAIIGMTTIAATAFDDRRRLEDCLGKIAVSSRHLLMLINDVLDMSKIESGKFLISNEPFELSDLLRNLTSIVYSQARSKGLHFDMSAEVEHESLRGDMLRVNQVLLNILSNAVKFTSPGGSISLTIKEIPLRVDNRVKMRFTVTDTGKGMSPEFLEKLFTPFEQEGKASKSGTGLGMAIASNLVTLMNGTIRVASTPGEGSTFEVDLPFETEEPCGNRHTGTLDELRVLVADHDPGSCEYATLILKRLGVMAEWVLSGSAAVDRVLSAWRREDSYDVVFMDWKMPDVDGIEATRRIRKHVGPDTVIIIISAYDWSEIEHEAREAGANAFISKPMLQSSIYNTLLSVTGTAEPSKQDAGTPDFSGRRFLLAEDNELNREVAVELLKMAGMSVDTVEDGGEAVKAFAASEPGTYDGILMDVQMPTMDGYEATRRIRRMERPDASIPILAMTANAFAEDVAAALESGMNGHIGKPIDIEVLFKTLSDVLEGRPRPSGERPSSR